MLPSLANFCWGAKPQSRNYLPGCKGRSRRSSELGWPLISPVFCRPRGCHLRQPRLPRVRPHRLPEALPEEDPRAGGGEDGSPKDTEVFLGGLGHVEGLGPRRMFPLQQPRMIYTLPSPLGAAASFRPDFPKNLHLNEAQKLLFSTHFHRGCSLCPKNLPGLAGGSGERCRWCPQSLLQPSRGILAR